MFDGMFTEALATLKDALKDEVPIETLEFVWTPKLEDPYEMTINQMIALKNSIDNFVCLLYQRFEEETIFKVKQLEISRYDTRDNKVIIDSVLELEDGVL